MNAKAANAALVGAVGINEDIKRIAATARRVNTMALNAILLAKRAGRMALGFGVLSNELRSFIHQIDDTTARLLAQTQDSVQAVSVDARQGQLQRILERTRDEVRLAGGDPGGIEALLETRARLAEVRCDRDRTLRRSMRMTLDDAEQLGHFGLVLARTARIEAAYGGAFAADLMQVAIDFDVTIREIIQHVHSLRERTREGNQP